MEFLRLKWLLPLLLLSSLYGAENLSWHASGKGGAVVAENPRAVAAGIELLEKGGNAVDAAVATMLVASIMDYGMFCIGAEVPFMIFDTKKKEVKPFVGWEVPRSIRTVSSGITSMLFPSRAELKRFQFPGR